MHKLNEKKMGKGVTSQDFSQGPGDCYPVATHVHGGLNQAFPRDAGVSIPKYCHAKLY
jgi:hypothetical protein